MVRLEVLSLEVAHLEVVCLVLCVVCLEVVCLGVVHLEVLGLSSVPWVMCPGSCARGPSRGSANAPPCVGKSEEPPGPTSGADGCALQTKVTMKCGPGIALDAPSSR